MPAGDGSGPRGMGSRTGRAAGFCAGYAQPGYTNPVVGRGGGFGFGRGFARVFCRGLGLGFRGGRRGGWGVGTGQAPYGAPAIPYAAGIPAAYGAGLTPAQEVDALKGQAEYFTNALEGIKQRIAELAVVSEDDK